MYFAAAVCTQKENAQIPRQAAKTAAFLGMTAPVMNNPGVGDDRSPLDWLRENDAEALGRLYQAADQVRREHVGDAVHLRGLIEISNHCRRMCLYCGLRAGNQGLPRYRMSPAEILDCARTALRLGYGTVVLQAGEDTVITGAWLAEVVRQIKAETGLAITLSMGERSPEELARWREAGADRYLLRFETSDPELFRRIHPPFPGQPADRIALLRQLREMGYEIGGGVMIGLPGQSFSSLARDIELFRQLDLDMVGVGPYIPHPATPLGKQFTGSAGVLAGGLPIPKKGSAGEDASATFSWERTQRCAEEAQEVSLASAFSPRTFASSASSAVKESGAEQVPNSEEMVYKVIALTRLACPAANIPSTTALASINRMDGRERGLASGANVVMPNLTPAQYRAWYEIYPNKACVFETGEQCAPCLERKIRGMGRVPGVGPGARNKNQYPPQRHRDTEKNSGFAISGFEVQELGKHPGAARSDMHTEVSTQILNPQS
jgi:biotin synthase